jgi:hypothetical protein
MQCHRFAYASRLRKGEEPLPFKIRDGAAFSEVSAPLPKLGYEYGELIFNPPFRRGKDRPLGKEHFRFIKREDLIVLTTRPPMDDKRQGDKKQMPQSRTHLEKMIFKACRKYFRVCARSHVELTRAVGVRCKKADFGFHQHRSARLKCYSRLGELRFTDVPRNTHTMIAFLLRTKSIPEYGCDLLVSFGMGGWETLIWNRIVRTQYPQWLTRPVFVVAELDMRKIPARTRTLDFVDQIKPTILLEHHIR